MLIWLAIACSDPDFGDYGDALHAYEDGRVAMSTGSPLVAAEAFARAAQADPSSEVLVAWEARALRAAEQNGAALSRLNAGVRRFPMGHLVRYDRAALRAKTGDISGAADDLRWLYAHEHANPIVVGEDSDFVMLRTDPIAKELVPQAQVEATVEAESGSVLVGDAHVLDFRITSRTGAAVKIARLEEGGQGLVIRRIVEDVIEEGPIWTRRRLRAEVLAVEPGRTVIGPWLVRAAGTSVITERVIVEAVELQGRRRGPDRDRNTLSLEVPTTRWADQAAPYLGIEQDGAWAVVSSDEDFRPKSMSLGLVMEVRHAGQPQWRALRISGEPGAEIWGDGRIKARLD